jgi:hypothetical protein
MSRHLDNVKRKLFSSPPPKAFKKKPKILLKNNDNIYQFTSDRFIPSRGEISGKSLTLENLFASRKASQSPYRKKTKKRNSPSLGNLGRGKKTRRTRRKSRK